MEEKNRSESYRRRRRSSLLDRDIMVPALIESFTKLDPRWQAGHPVMFVVEVGSVITTIIFIAGLVRGASDSLFVGQITLWLWFTVVFANFAEALAEGRGKAQAATLRRARTDTVARRLVGGKEDPVPSSQLRKGDIVVIEAGDRIPRPPPITPPNPTIHTPPSHTQPPPPLPQPAPTPTPR